MLEPSTLLLAGLTGLFGFISGALFGFANGMEKMRQIKLDELMTLLCEEEVEELDPHVHQHINQHRRKTDERSDQTTGEAC